MIIIPLFMPCPKIGFYTYSLEEKMKITARREVVLQVLRESGALTAQEIADKVNLDGRTIQAILAVLKKYGNIESSIIDDRKVWKVIWN